MRGLPGGWVWRIYFSGLNNESRVLGGLLLCIYFQGTRDYRVLKGGGFKGGI